MGVPGLGSIHVHAQRLYAGEAIAKLLLHLLCAYAKKLYVRFAAFRAYLWYILCASAVMALHKLIYFMIGHGYVAVVALEYITAAPAGYEGGIPTAVYEEYRLLISVEAGFQLMVQPSAEYAGISGTGDLL